MRRAGCVAVLFLAACHAKVSSKVEVDGKPFDVAECRSGQAFGFNGLQVADAAGTRIRFILQADGSAQIAIFAPNAPRGDMLGTCGTITLNAQHSRINSIRNVEGTATLSCNALGHKLEGSLSFENCH